MKNLWCWRCKMEIPMLDDDEFAIAYDLYGQGFRNIKAGQDRELRFKALLDYYKKVTGFGETESNAVLHHRISDYSPPCENCGKPYRTPLASARYLKTKYKERPNLFAHWLLVHP